MHGTAESVLLPLCSAEKLPAPPDTGSENQHQGLIPSQRAFYSPASVAGFGQGQQAGFWG